MGNDEKIMDKSISKFQKDTQKILEFFDDKELMDIFESKFIHIDQVKKIIEKDYECLIDIKHVVGTKKKYGIELLNIHKKEILKELTKQRGKNEFHK